MNIAASTESENFARIPRQDEMKLTPDAAYVHMTTEQHAVRAPSGQALPDVGDVPLVADTSSDMFSRPIDVAKYGLIYAGAQKNLGPVRRDARHHPRGPAGALAASRCTRC